MRAFVLLFAALGINVQAANLYVWRGATGSGTGADWANAMTQLPTAPSRGTTVYLGAGNYNGWSMTTPASGTTVITVKKATVADHGTSTGWSDSIATGQAITHTLQFWTPYWVFDGVTGSGTSGYGILVRSTDTNNFSVGTWSGTPVGDVTVRRLEVTGRSWDDSLYSTHVGISFASNTGNNWVIENNYIHNCGAAWVAIGTSTNTIIRNNWMTKLGSGTTLAHADGIRLSGYKDIYVYNNDFSDCVSFCTTYIAPQGTGNGLYVYNNRFFSTRSDELTSQGSLCIAGGAGPEIFNTYFIGNTSYGLHGGSVGVWGGTAPGTYWVGVTNNVWQACTPGMGSFPHTRMAENILNTGEVNFVDPVNYNFRLAGNTSSGITHGSPYDVDADGVTRIPGAWSKGAYQYGGSTPPPSPPGSMTFGSATASVLEGGGSIVIPVSRVGGTNGAVGVSYATANGTAVAGTHYTSTSGTLSWVAGNGADNTITVPIIDNLADGLDRTFTITLSSPTGGTLGSITVITVTIVDDDDPTIPSLAFPTFQAESMLLTDGLTASFTAGPTYIVQTVDSLASPIEGGRARANITIPTEDDYRVKFKIQAEQLYQNSLWINFDTAPPDYGIADFIPPTSGYETRTVPWRGNGSGDAPQILTNVWHLTAGVHMVDIRGREALAYLDEITIESLSDAQTVAFLNNSQIANEGSPQVEAPVVRLSSLLGTIQAGYLTIDGSALAGVNYYSTNGTLTFVDGVASQSVFVDLINNSIFSADTVFYLKLTNAVDCVLADPLLIPVLIQDNDAPNRVMRVKTAKVGRIVKP